MHKPAAACAAVAVFVALCAAALASVQMQTALPLWDLSPSELAVLAHARWATARAGMRALFSDGAAPVPGRLAAVLLQARLCLGALRLSKLVLLASECVAFLRKTAGEHKRSGAAPAGGGGRV